MHFINETMTYEIKNKILMEDLNPDLISEILSQYSSDIPIWENEQFIQQSIRESEQQIQSLESQLNETNSHLNQGKDEWNEIKSNNFDMKKCKEELNSIKNEIKTPLNTIAQFFEQNQNEIDLFTEFNQISNVLSIASVSLQSDNIINSTNMIDIFEKCEKNNYSNLLKMTQERYEKASATERNKIYQQIEKVLQSFAVTKLKSLEAMFLKKESLLSSKSDEYKQLIDQVSKMDLNWAKTFIDLAKNVFVSRFQFHCQNSDLNSSVSCVSLITNLLRVTIQSLFIITNYPEKLSPESKIFSCITHELLKAGMQEALSKNNGSCQFYRSLFEQGCILDKWLISLDFYDLELFCPIIFDTIGNNWLQTECDTISVLTTKSLQATDNDDFAFTICSALSELFNSKPSSLTDSQIELFVKKCILPSEKQITSLLANSFDKSLQTTNNEPLSNSNFKKASKILNAYLLLSVQLVEIFEIDDGKFQEILQDSKKARKSCYANCERLAKTVFNIFETKGANYLLSTSINWRNGTVTPSLATALVSISDPINIVRENIDKILFENQFISIVSQEIDKKVYKMIALRVDWSQPGSIDQFVVDLDAMIDLLGGEDLRLLRSVRMFLTSKEEKYLNYEIPEEDVEKFVMAAKEARGK